MEIGDGGTLLAQTLARVSPLGPVRLVVGLPHEPLARAEGGCEMRLIVEPAPRDTAAAIAVGVLDVLAEAADAVVVVCPADHFIPSDEAFRAAVKEAARAAAQADDICLLGLKPRQASDAYGYICPTGQGLSPIAGFVEKPDAVHAARLMDQGALWNIGVFVATAGRLTRALADHAPAVLAAARAGISAADRSALSVRLGPGFAEAPAVAFDRAVMERCGGGLVLPVEFDWRDLGAWDAVAEVEALAARHRLIDSPGAYVRAPENVTVATLGLPGVAVVVEGDQVLACRLEDAQSVRRIAEEMQRRAETPASLEGPPLTELAPNDWTRETRPFVQPGGFRDYDARWRLGEEINLLGVQAVGLGLATLLAERGRSRRIIIGHDFRSYSQAVKQALSLGLIAGGMEVLDIGLCLTPSAYFARGHLGCENLAMVTASHNENGWTGIKMGDRAPFTFESADMAALRAIVLEGRGRPRSGGAVRRVEGLREAYLQSVVGARHLSRPIRVVVGCGNGTAGVFAPEALKRLGADVISLNADLDAAFPHHNPNPEDRTMLMAVGEAVRAAGADIGLAFDGDGDRCGVVDEAGIAVLSDRVGLILARDMAARTPGAVFVVDVKCTGLFRTDPVLVRNGARVVTAPTGHSHIKRALHEVGALAAFEKSGHIYFGPPIGRGYDDALAAAVEVLSLLDLRRAPLSLLAAEPGQAWTSLTLSPRCADGAKHGVVARARDAYAALAASGASILGRGIRGVETTDGVRVELDDGSWFLMRASSNKPELTVVVESLRSEDDMRDLFRLEARPRLATEPEVGEYNQEI